MTFIITETTQTLKAMKQFFILFYLIFFFLPHLSLKAASPEKFYVGTFTSGGAEGIYLCSFNSDTGEISLLKTFAGIENPSFLKISPDRKKLYAVTRLQKNSGKPEGYVNAYAILHDGELQLLNSQSSNGSDPCYVDVSADGKFVAVANYGSGSTSLYRTNEDGSLNPASSVIVNKGSGPNLSRQKSPHAHSIRFSPDGKQLFSADLGTDKLNIFNLKRGKLQPAKQQFVSLPPGSGPRHFDYHPGSSIIYVVNELISTVSVLQKKGKNLEVIQTVSTTPKDFTGTTYCAEVRVSNDGRHVYASNRGHNSISVLNVDPVSHKLNLLTTVSTEGEWPRHFTLSPDGKFLLVANQNSGNIVVFKINEKSGVPELTGFELKLPAPVCLEFL